jgi:hypothetical protein
MKVNQIVSEIKKGSKDSNGFTKCWPGKHAEGTKKGKNGGQVRNCVPNESVSEAANAAQQAAIAIAKKKKKSMAEGAMSEIHIELSNIVANEDFDALYELFSANTPAGRYVQAMADDVTIDHGLHPDDDFEKIEEIVFNRLENEFGENTMEDVDVTLKPLPGAQQVDINGKPAGTATTPQAAAAISDLAKKGEFTPVTDQPTTEGLFNTSEEELAKDPSPAGDYYRKLAALKTDPRWVGKQDIVQKRIQDLINRIDLDKGIPQPGQGQPAGPETDPAKFQQRNPNFKEAHKDTIAQGGGTIGGDPTDRYLSQIIDKKFTKAQRGTLSENDELYKWLTIAGIR